MPTVEEIEKEKAYSASRCDIEMYCHGSLTHGVIWFDLSKLDSDGDADAVATAVTYLDSKGYLKHHETNPNLVSILPRVA